MKISIIIPVYNVAPYIEECIQSVMNQTYKNLEVLIVDDCGTDNSMDLVFRMLGNQEVVVRQNILFRVIHHDRNKGLSEARNTGIEEASGDYIYFLDSDDYIVPNCLELMATKALETHADCIESRFLTSNDDTRKFPIGYKESKKEIMNLFYVRTMHIEAWGRLVKRDLIIKNHLRFFKNLISEDVPWSLEVYCLANSFYFIDDKLYIYRKREGSIMTSEKFENKLASYSILLSLCENIAKRYKIINEHGFEDWIEFYKALFFENTRVQGSFDQLKWCYSEIIRKIHPIPAFNKDQIHYLFPKFFGFYIYRRFYGRRFC